jgi:hypothetical protein
MQCPTCGALGECATTLCVALSSPNVGGSHQGCALHVQPTAALLCASTQNPIPFCFCSTTRGAPDPDLTFRGLPLALFLPNTAGALCQECGQWIRVTASEAESASSNHHTSLSSLFDERAAQHHCPDGHRVHESDDQEEDDDIVAIQLAQALFADASEEGQDDSGEASAEESSVGECQDSGEAEETSAGDCQDSEEAEESSAGDCLPLLIVHYVDGLNNAGIQSTSSTGQNLELHMAWVLGNTL